MMRSRYGTLIIVYLVIGVIVAVIKDYVDLDSVADIISLALAIALWPLVLLGIDLHVGDGGRRRRGALVGALPMLTYIRAMMKRGLNRR